MGIGVLDSDIGSRLIVFITGNLLTCMYPPIPWMISSSVKLSTKFFAIYGSYSTPTFTGIIGWESFLFLISSTILEWRTNLGGEAIGEWSQALLFTLCGELLD